jgi:hypothetical protein
MKRSHPAHGPSICQNCSDRGACGFVLVGNPDISPIFEPCLRPVAQVAPSAGFGDLSGTGGTRLEGGKAGEECSPQATAGCYETREAWGRETIGWPVSCRPAGAQGSYWVAFPGFHPGLLSFPPYGRLLRNALGRNFSTNPVEQGLKPALILRRLLARLKPCPCYKAQSSRVW